MLQLVLQAEPCGNLNLDTDNAEALGLGGLDEEQLKLVSSMVLNRPVCATEAACSLLNIPIVQMSERVYYFKSQPLQFRTRRVVNSFIVNEELPIGMYMARPVELEDVTFCDYFTLYEVFGSKEGDIKKGYTYVAPDWLQRQVRMTQQIFAVIFNAKMMFFPNNDTCPACVPMTRFSRLTTLGPHGSQTTTQHIAQSDFSTTCCYSKCPSERKRT